MILAYIDESGISYEVKNKFFKDGPYAIWSSVLVSETKYFHTERLFYELVKDLLGIKDWREIELHASEIWNRRGYFKRIPQKKIVVYFEELFQLLSKLKLNVVVGIQQKNIKRRSPRAQKKELENSVYAFLTCLEHKLSELNETAVLIADSAEEEQTQRIQELLYERTKWRYNPGARRSRRYKSKFRFETYSCFFLDQIHYTDSSTSFFVQLSDHVAYVLQRVLAYSYLKCFPKASIRPDINQVPLTPETFKFFSSCVSLGEYKVVLQDVSMSELFRYVSSVKDEYLNKECMLSISQYK